MIARFIAELAEGSRVDAVYQLRAREMRAARTGDAYLSLEFADKTGSISGVLFRPRAQATAIPTGSAVRVRGTVTRFRGSRRISVESMDPASEWDPADLIGRGDRPVAELRHELYALVKRVTRPEIKALLRTVFGDASFMERFCALPASNSAHRAYSGGLLEHTVEVTAMCLDISLKRPEVDRDLLITAALLHDVGQIDALDIGVGVQQTDMGRLVGHEVSGVLRIEAGARASGVSGEILMRLQHAVLAHHYGADGTSVQRPATIEALLLAHVDALDASAATFLGALRGAQVIGERWADADNRFGRPIYAADPFGRAQEPHGRSKAGESRHVGLRIA